MLVGFAIPWQELNVVESAVRAGVQHVVKIRSKASLDSPIARRRRQAEIENGLIASGLRYALLKNNADLQNFLMMQERRPKQGPASLATSAARD